LIGIENFNLVINYYLIDIKKQLNIELKNFWVVLFIEIKLEEFEDYKILKISYPREWKVSI
jgi:hypothetical protein